VKFGGFLGVSLKKRPCGSPVLSRSGDTMDSMRQRILVVDDDASLAEMLTIVLRGEGFDTAVVGDGTQALTAVRELRHVSNADAETVGFITTSFHPRPIINSCSDSWLPAVIQYDSGITTSSALISRRYRLSILPSSVETALKTATSRHQAS